MSPYRDPPSTRSFEQIEEYVLLVRIAEDIGIPQGEAVENIYETIFGVDE